MLQDETISSSKQIDDWPVVLVGSIMGVSMGFQNVAAKESIKNCPPTTVDSHSNQAKLTLTIQTITAI
jgi:hypothetical protein